MVDADTADLGGMIALLPADPTPLVVDHPQADPADDIHVTLAYLGGDVSGWDAQRQARVDDGSEIVGVPARHELGAEPQTGGLRREAVLIKDVVAKPRLSSHLLAKHNHARIGGECQEGVQHLLHGLGFGRLRLWLCWQRRWL